MVRKVRATIISSDDEDFGKIEEDVVLLASDILFESYGGEWVLRVLPAGLSEPIEIDLAKCPVINIGVDSEDSVDPQFLATASFLDVVRRFAK